MTNQINNITIHIHFFYTLEPLFGVGQLIDWKVF
jgi:hypothetical protein